MHMVNTHAHLIDLRFSLFVVVLLRPSEPCGSPILLILNYWKKRILLFLEEMCDLQICIQFHIFEYIQRKHERLWLSIAIFLTVTSEMKGIRIIS